MTHDKAKEIFSLIGFETTDKDLLQIFCDFARVVQEDENEACANVAAWILKMPENDISAAIRARREQ